MYIEVYTDNWKNINRITFYFVEGGSDRGLEDIKKEFKCQLFIFFLLFCLFDGRHAWKNHNKLKKKLHSNRKRRNTCIPEKNKKRTNYGKRRLSCDSDTPQVGSARSESTRVVKVNRPKTNRRKMRPGSS